MKNSLRRWGIVGAFAIGGSVVAHGQIVLSGSNYDESFDDLAGGLPTGWGVYSGATSSSLGNTATFTATTTTWTASPSAGFFNVAAAESPLTSNSNNSSQNSALDRALGVGATGANFDPGAGITVTFQDTLGLQNFDLSFTFQKYGNTGRTTTYTVDYRLGSSGAFTSLGTISSDVLSGWGSSAQGFAGPATWDNQAQSLTVRLVALSAATGSGANRDFVGLDDFSMTFSPTAVPEPGEYAGVFLGGLVLFGLVRRKDMFKG